MNKLNRLLALLAALMLALVPVLSACAESEAAEESIYPLTGNADDVMATVNGVPVLRSTVEALYNNVYETYSYYGAYYGIDVTDAETRNMMYGLALYLTTSYEVEAQKAEELGFATFTEEDLAAITEEANTTWEGYISSYITYYGGGLADDASEEDKLAARTNAIAGLEAMGYTYEGLIEDSKNTVAQEKLKAYAAKDVAITDEAIVDAFNAQVAADQEAYSNDIYSYELYTQYYGTESYYIPEGYRGVTHILLNVDDTLLSTYQDLEARYEEQQSADATSAEEGTSAETTDEAAAEATAAPVTAEDVEAARAAVIASVQDKIDTIYARLDAGESFESLIAEFGNDPGMESEPYASEGYSVNANSVLFDPVFVEAAFSVSNVGDVSQPYVGSYGVHIVKYLRDVPSGAIEMTDDIKASIAESLQTEAENTAYDNAVTDWMKASEIVFTDEASRAIMVSVGYLTEDGQIVYAE